MTATRLYKVNHYEKYMNMQHKKRKKGVRFCYIDCNLISFLLSIEQYAISKYLRHYYPNHEFWNWVHQAIPGKDQNTTTTTTTMMHHPHRH